MRWHHCPVPKFAPRDESLERECMRCKTTKATTFCLACGAWALCDQCMPFIAGSMQRRGGYRGRMPGVPPGRGYRVDPRDLGGRMPENLIVRPPGGFEDRELLPPQRDPRNPRNPYDGRRDENLIARPPGAMW
jgi:hypothetical protein